jgi:siroheme synthase-like protein
MQGYPIFLIGLETRRCVVIGGNAEAERKVAGLLECQADVTVISTEVTAQLRCWVEDGRAAWVPRAYQQGDLQGAYLVIVTDSPSPMRPLIFQEAETERALLNMADDTPHCHFIAGSVLHQGALTIAISTNGYAPALAVRLRQQLESMFGPEYATFLDWLHAVREPIARQYPELTERRARWYALVDSDILMLLRQGQEELARQRFAELLTAPVSALTTATTVSTWGRQPPGRQ